jgi:arginase family enzyme
VIRSPEQRVFLFGCPLDCDEKHDAIQEKLSEPDLHTRSDDPLIAVAEALSRQVPQSEWEFGGSLEVPGWLRPIPGGDERSGVLVEAYVHFIDQNGCLDFADGIAEIVRSQILPRFPCLVAVDHSLTGGVYRALAEYYGKDQVSLMVIDSHTDAVPMSKLAGAISYDMETNPSSPYDPADPYLSNRPESYNASSFLYYLVADKLVDPHDLYILGVSDYPEKKALRINDPRITDYISAYADLREKGATIVTKRDCQLKPTKVKTLLKRIRTPYAYVSIDMDIGALNALNGVRFRNWQGLSETQIYRLVDTICQAGKSEVQIVGMDVTEINPRIAGRKWGEAVDRTYQIAASLVKRIAFGQAFG